MLRNLTLFVTLLLGFSLVETISAQHNHLGCGTTTQDQDRIKDQLFENRRNKAQLMATYNDAIRMRNANDSTLWVPVVFHMCSRADGTGQQNDAWVLQEMCYFNQNYADQNIQFYLVDINRFNSNQMYVNAEANSDYIRSIHRVNNVVNIYVAGPAVGGTQYGAYYAPNWDWIFTWNDIYNWGLSHEVGHMFTLAHTFNGWEGTDYATESAANGYAPMMGTNGRPVEKVARGVAGENCQYAADGFCDTPPDYASGGGGCNMPSNWFDPDSVQVQVSNTDNPLNYMSYFFCGPKKFTDDQKDAIKLDVVRRWNASQDAPSPLTVTNAPNILCPSNGAIAPYTSAPVHFTWEDSGNHGMYLFTCDRTTLNGAVVVNNIATRLVRGNETWLTLTPNLEYRWSVRALTAYDLCNNPANASTPALFTTANWPLSNDQVEATVLSSNVYPNPTGMNDEVMVEVEVPFEAQVQITISNTLGQMVMPAQQMNVFSGKNIELLNVRDLSAGMYFVNIETGNQVITHKLIVNK